MIDLVDLPEVNKSGYAILLLGANVECQGATVSSISALIVCMRFSP